MTDDSADITGEWVSVFLDDEIVQRLKEIQQEVQETHIKMNTLFNTYERVNEAAALDDYHVQKATLNTELNDLEQERIGIELQLGKDMVESLMEHLENGV